METLGQRISILRNDYNLTQRALMDLLNFDNLSKYEKDLREPKLEVLIKLSEHFKVTLDWLITGKENLSNKNTSNDNIDIEELNILKLYRGLNQTDKIKIEGIMESKIAETESSATLAESYTCQNGGEDKNVG